MKVEVYNDYVHGWQSFKLSFDGMPTMELSISEEQLALMHPEAATDYVAHAFSNEVHRHILTAMKNLNANGKTLNKYSDIAKLGSITPYINQPAADAGVEALARQLPAADIVYDGSMCKCKNLTGTPLYKKIIHWNDSHKYSREEIADYLDKLHDAGVINIEFDPWKDEDE